MQIHELNVFNGNLKGNTYVALDDGSDTGKATLVEILSEVNKRIDNIIAGGAAPSEAEIIDARLGADGNVYSSLGDAIRSQVGYLQDDLIPILKDSVTEVALGWTAAAGFYNKNGTFDTYPNIYTASVNVVPGQLYFLTSDNYYNMARAVFFDGNNNVISTVWTGNNADPNDKTPIRVPEDAATMLIQNAYMGDQHLYIPDVDSMFTDLMNKLDEIMQATTQPSLTEVPLTFSATTGFYNKNGNFDTYSDVTVADVNVTAGDTYYLNSRNFYNCAMAVFFDSNNTFVGSVWDGGGTTPQNNYEIVIPTGVERMLIQRVYGYQTTLFKATGIERKAIESVLSGMNITAIGDSITEHNFRAKTNWVNYLTSWCGVTIQNLGKSGTGFRAGYATNNNYINRISSVQADPDAIGVAVSFNDISDGSVVIGDPTDTGTATLAGYANDFFDALITAFPTTPIICYVQNPWWSYHYGVARSDEWMDVLTQICGLKGIPLYIDLYNGGVLKPWLLACRQEYFTSDDPNDNPGVVDSEHPNSEGHKVIARYLYPKFAENLVTTGINYK